MFGMQAVLNVILDVIPCGIKKIPDNDTLPEQKSNIN
jgi:hypothetical protein